MLIELWFIACSIMINAFETACVRCATFRCKPYIVSLNDLSWCFILLSSFPWNFCSPNVPTFCSFDSFLLIFFITLVFWEIVRFFTWCFSLCWCTWKIWSKFDVFEMFQLSLTVVKVSSWKFNSERNADASSFTYSAGSSSYRGWLLHPVWYVSFRYPAAYLKILAEDLNLRPRILIPGRGFESRFVD